MLKKKYSIIKELEEQGKLDSSTLVQISNLELQDLIAVKLELSSKIAHNRLYGLPIIHNLKWIVEEAILKFASSNSENYSQMKSFLGISERRFQSLKGKFPYFFNK